MMKRSQRIGAVIALGFAAYAANASAQDQTWLKDRRYREGIGIRTGALELHPGIAAELGYDTNFFLRSDRFNPPGALRVRVTPSLSLATIGQLRREGDAGGVAVEPPKLTLRANIAATYNEFFATESQTSTTVSNQRHLGGLANLHLTIFPSRPWSGDLYGNFARTVQPSINPEFNYNRLATSFGAGITWAPGGGMFDWRLGYELGLTYFEDQSFNNLSTAQHQVNTRGRWRFLPRTSLIYDASLGFLQYANRPAGRLDSSPVRARLGLNGLVTPSFSLLAMAGWGSSFYQGHPSAEQYDGLIGQAEVRWFVTPPHEATAPTAMTAMSSIALGYLRDFGNSYLADFYRRDRVYLTGSFHVAGRFVATLEGGAALHEYSTVYAAGTRAFLHSPFRETRLDATLFGEYRFADAFGLNTTLRYSANVTDVYVDFVQDEPGRSRVYLDWKRFEAYLGLRWFM